MSLRIFRFRDHMLDEYNAEDSSPLSAQSGLVPLSEGGSYDAHGGDLILQSRVLSRTFEIWPGDSQTIAERIDDLGKEIGKGEGLLQGYTRDGDIRQTFAKLRSVEAGRKPGQLGFQPVKLSWELPYPYWLSRADEPRYLSEGYTLDGSWTLSAGNIESQSVTASPHTFTIDNDGGYKVIRGFIRLEVQAGGSIENPKIENTTNGWWLKYVGTLSAGDVLDLDLLAQTAYLNNSNAWDDMAISDSQMWLMQLELGDNDIEVTADSISGTTDLDWQWSRHWLL